MLSDDQDVKIMTWILESVKLNKGYGVSRLALRIKEKFPESQWPEGKINNYLGRHDHREGTNLLELISVDDNSKTRKPFQDPDNVYVAEDIAEKESKKISRNRQGQMERRNDIGRTRVQRSMERTTLPRSTI